MIGVLAEAVVAATAGPYVINLTSSLPPKLFVRGEYTWGPLCEPPWLGSSAMPPV
jgi:hypothetical protein